MPGLSQTLFVNGQALGTGTSTRYHPTLASWWGSNTVVGRATQLVDHAITLRKWRLRIPTAPGSGVTRTWTVYKNGSSTALSIAISGTNTTGSDLSDSVTFAAGDTTYVEEVVTGGTPADTGPVQATFEIENPDSTTSFYGFGNIALETATGTTYMGLLYGGAWSSTGDRVESIAAADGTVTSYRIGLSVAPGAGKSRTFILEKNGTAQDGTGGTPDTTITISDSATTGTWSGTLSVVATDRLRIRHTRTNSPADSAVNGSASFVASTAGRWNLGGRSDDTPATGSTEYLMPFGQYGTTDPWQATETDRENLGPDTSLTLSGMYALLTAQPGAGKSYALTLRLNQANTAQAVTIADTNTSGTSAGGSVTVTSADRVSLQSVPSSTPAAVRVGIAFLMTDPIVASGGFNALLIAP